MISSTNKKLKVTDLNPFLICVLCKGYYIDATTIVECLHSFCKTCIVKYLKRHKYCPICDVLVYKTKPLQNIRPDKRLQNVVYKLIPGLYEREMQRRQLFFSSSSVQNSLNLTGEEKGIITESSDIILPDENISITLEYLAHSTEDMNKAIYGRRYLRCKASAPVSILHKFLKSKYNLTNKHCVELVCNNEPLTGALSVMDVAYIYQWRKKTPMYLGYRILESKIKRLCEKEETESPKRLKLNTDVPQQGMVEPYASGPTKNCKLNSEVTEKFLRKSDSLLNTELPKPNEIPSLGLGNHINTKPMPLSKSQGANNPQEWKEVELKINDNGEMSATVLPPSVSVVTTQTAPVTSSACQQNNGNIPRTSESRVSTPGFKSEMAHCSQGSVVTSINSVLSNRATVYPMVQESKATTQMTFSNPHMKVPVSSPGVYMPRGSRPRAPSVPRYKTLKTGVQPWNPTVSRSKVSVGNSDPLKSQDNVSKIFKSRNARFLNSPSPPTTMPKLQDSPKPRAINSTLTKVDPRTLSPIVPVSSSTNSRVDSPTYISTPSSPSHLSGDKLNKFVRPSQIKDFNPFLHPSLMYPGFLPYPPDNMSLLPSAHPADNPLLPNSHPDFMKAMSALYQHNPAFHSSLPPSISTLFNFRLPSQNEKKSSSNSCPRSSSQSSVGSRPTSSSELPRSTASNHIYSLSSLPSSISVSPTSSNSHHLPASIKSYIPLNSISNSKVSSVSKSFSPVKSSPSSKDKSPNSVNSIFSPANMVASSNSTSSKSYSPSMSTSSQPLSLVTTSVLPYDARKQSNKETEHKGSPAVPLTTNSTSSLTSVSNTTSSIKSEKATAVSSQSSAKSTQSEGKHSFTEIKNLVKDKTEKTSGIKADVNEVVKTNNLTNGENNNHLKPPSLTN